MNFRKIKLKKIKKKYLPDFERFRKPYRSILHYIYQTTDARKCKQKKNKIKK